MMVFSKASASRVAVSVSLALIGPGLGGITILAGGDAPAAGAGFGPDDQLGQHLGANPTTACALEHEGLTRASQFRLESRVALTF